MTRASRPGKHPPSGTGIGYSREFLEHLARILVDAGHSPRKLAREFREICSGLREPVRRWNPAELRYLPDIARVNSCWHYDPQFLDSKGDPIPLPLRSRGPCLVSLVARALPKEEAAAVIDSLLREGGLRRRGGLYLPTDRQVLYRPQSARIHGLVSLLGMLRTLEHNVSVSASSARLVERTAVSAEFPVRALPMFHRWLKRFASKVLWDADGRMRKRAWMSLPGPTIRLGVSLFAFEDPQTTGRSAGGNSARRRLPRRRRPRSAIRGRR